MFEPLRLLFDPSGFPARWNCGSWSSFHGWTHVGADLAIWGAYMGIPMALGWYAWRRRDVPFRPIYWLFAAFIFSCGFTHLVEACIFWWPVYRFSAAMKVGTALVSWLTLAALVRVAPRALDMPRIAELNRELHHQVLAGEERFQRAVRGSSDGLWDWDVHADELWLSPRFMELLGFPSTHVPKDIEFWETVVHPDDRGRMMTALRGCAGDGEGGFDLECRLQRVGGGELWVRARGQAFHSAEQEGRLHLAGSISDISRRKAAEQEQARTAAELKKLADNLEKRVERRTRELRASNRDFQTFAYAASHDLKAPLRAVSGYFQMLDKSLGKKATPDERELLDGALENIQQMGRLIDGLLALSRVRQSKDKRALIPLDRPLERVLSILAAQIKEAGAQVSRPPQMPQVRANEAQMTQLFQNLIENALKFRAPSRPPRIAVTVEPEAGGFVVGVRDNGAGFKPEHAERAFDLFKRLHAPSEYEGTGIGLAICKKIVERHGGSMRAEGKPGKGAAFFFSLPGEASEEDSARGGKAPERRNG